MFTRTKIVCTMGPATASYEKIVQLMEAGMNVARLNFSHGTHDEHLQTIKNLKKARNALQRPLAVMLDMKGPKISIGKVQGDKLTLHAKQKIRLRENGNGSSDEIPVHPVDVLSVLRPGMKVLFDDGYIIGIVVAAKADEATIEIQNAGVLKSGKGVAIPGVKVPLPPLIAEDFEDLVFGCKHEVDWIAASFVRSHHHVLLIKDFLAKQGCPDMPIIAKIEDKEGIDHFDSILEAADGIMVARGDLGVELDLALVPPLQKMMILKCNQASKPVITATQMLESMITNPRPTRAEVSDVANAVYDGTSATMLSAETAVGGYPVETVLYMKKIAAEAESDYHFREFFEEQVLKDHSGIGSSVALAAVRTAYSAHAKAIFSIATSKETTRLVSRLRPQMPVITVVKEEKYFHQLSLVWGVIPVLCPECKTAKQAFTKAAQFATEQGIIAFGDIVVVTTGVSFGETAMMNMMVVESVGDILARGCSGVGRTVKGKVHFVHSPQDNLDKGKILLLTRCDHTFLPLLEKAKGVILQNSKEDVASEQYLAMAMQNLNGSAVFRVKDITSLLKSNEEVTIDPKRGLIYRDESHHFPHFPG